MKKSLFMLTTALFLGACAQGIPEQLSTSFSDKKTQMKACLTTQAMAQIQDGSAFASPIRTTVQTMATTCIQQLMPATQQTAAVESETQQQAQSILTTLLNASTATQKE